MKRGIACRPPDEVAKKLSAFCNMQNAYNPISNYDFRRGTGLQPKAGRQKKDTYSI
jgi:hypothetical protein